MTVGAVRKHVGHEADVITSETIVHGIVISCTAGSTWVVSSEDQDLLIHTVEIIEVRVC